MRGGSLDRPPAKESVTWRNEAHWDRVTRVVVGVAMLMVGWNEVLPEPWSAALKIFAVFPLVTGLLGWCPFYSLTAYRTWGKKHRR